MKPRVQSSEPLMVKGEGEYDRVIGRVSLIKVQYMYIWK
jgi:hypothetical protein